MSTTSAFVGGLLVVLGFVLPRTCFAQSEADCPTTPGYLEVALRGEQRDSVAGFAVAALGDINGDGMGDYAVNAPQYAYSSNPLAGLTYVLYGNPRQRSISLADIGPNAPAGASAGFVIAGGYLELVQGQRISAMGDLDGDGIDDFAIADSNAFAPSGARPGGVYLFYGRRAEAGVAAFPAEIVLRSVDSGVYGDQVRAHYGNNAGGEFFGAGIVGLGDVNGDGRTDFAIARPGSDVPMPNSGEVLVYFGVAGRPSQIEPGVTLRGSEQFGNLGRLMGGDFDFDADGVNDFLVCETFETGRGDCYLLWGSTLPSLGAQFVIKQLRPELGGDGSLGMVLRGGERGALGQSESRFNGTLDLNGDGRDDLVFGSARARPDGPGTADDPGRVYVLYGSAAKLHVQVSMAEIAQAIPGPSQLGFALEGPPLLFGQFGRAVVSAGDVNNDGVDDLLIGAQGDRPCGGGFCGSAWVVMGRRGLNAFSPLTRISEAALAGGLGYRVGPTPTQLSSEQFGVAAASLPDFTGDGKPEWLIGAHVSYFDDGVRGKACLYLSSNGQVFAQPPPVAIDAGDWRSWLALSGLLLIVGAMVLRCRLD